MFWWMLAGCVKGRSGLGCAGWRVHRCSCFGVRRLTPSLWQDACFSTLPPIQRVCAQYHSDHGSVPGHPRPLKFFPPATHHPSHSTGTHHWSKFLTPTELTQLFRAHTPFHLWQLAGMEFNPVTGTWSLGTNTSINYAACFTRAAANAPLAEEPAEYPPPEQ